MTWTSIGPDRRTTRLMTEPLKQLAPARPAAGAEHDLGRVLGAGQVDERAGDVVADDLAVLAAELARAGGAARPSSTAPARRVRQARCRRRRARRSGRPWPAGRCAPRGARGGRCPAPRTARRRPARGSPTAARCRGGRGSRRSSSSTRSATHSRASSRSAVRLPGAEVVAERGVDPVCGVHVAVGQPAAQRLRGHVDQLDLVGGPHDLVRDGLPLLDAGDPLDDVVERFEVLDVDGRDDVDASGQQLLDVLPALVVARARARWCGPARRRGRPAGCRRRIGVDVHLRERGSRGARRSSRARPRGRRSARPCGLGRGSRRGRRRRRFPAPGGGGPR